MKQLAQTSSETIESIYRDKESKFVQKFGNLDVISTNTKPIYDKQRTPNNIIPHLKRMTKAP